MKGREIVREETARLPPLLPPLPSSALPLLPPPLLSSLLSVCPVLEVG